MTSQATTLWNVSTIRSIRLGLFLAIMAALALAPPAHAQMQIGTVPVQNGAYLIATNNATDTVYVVNSCGTDPSCSGTTPGTVTVINGQNDTVTATVTVGINPVWATVNSVTNKIYVANRHDNNISVISGATNTVTKTISVGRHPTVMDVNLVTNKIYVVNNGNGQGTTMSVIDGNTDTVTATVTVGNYPVSVAVNPVINMVYVANYCGNQFGCNATPAPGTVSVINGATNTVTHTVTVGYGPSIVEVNNVTNKIWVANSCGNDSSCDFTGDNTNVIGTVTQIDGASFATQTVNTGNGQVAMANNAVANLVFVTNNTDNTESVINGATLGVSTVSVGTAPDDVEVNPVTNTAFVCNSGSNNVTLINGATLATTTVNVGNTPVVAWVNPVVNREYVSNVGDGTISVLSGVPPNAIQFVNVTPCRLIDTRQNGGLPIQGGTSENFYVPQLGGCNIPSSATAYSLNVTVVPSSSLGYLTIWPTGQAQPLVSTLNSQDGRVKANAAIVPAGYDGGVSVFVTQTAHIILDIDGYFTTPSSQTYEFYPLTPCRVADTRQTNFPQGLGAPSFANMETRSLPVLSSPCLSGISNALAYSFNVTVDPSPTGQPLNYLTAWPTGQTMPVVSTLNNPTATVVANGALVPAGTDGKIDVFTYNSTDVIIDINGYFAAPGANGYSFYPTTPCRIYDSRSNNGQPFQGERTVDVVDSPCAPPTNAKGYVLNATVVPEPTLGYLILWPDTEDMPVVSTLNAYDGRNTSNLAIVPNVNGKTDSYASDLTHLILDISGYFAP